MSACLALLPPGSVDGRLYSREAMPREPFVRAAAWQRLVAPMAVKTEATAISAHRPQVRAIRLSDTLHAGSTEQGVRGNLRAACVHSRFGGGALLVVQHGAARGAKHAGVERAADALSF